VECIAVGLEQCGFDPNTKDAAPAAISGAGVPHLYMSFWLYTLVKPDILQIFRV